MHTVLIQPTFESWRDAARDLLARKVPPGEILWSDEPQEIPLFSAACATPGERQGPTSGRSGERAENENSNEMPKFPGLAENGHLLHPDRPEVGPCPPAHSRQVPRVPAAFLDRARSASAHRDPRRWGLLYQILWRITHGGERNLLQIPTDPDMRLLGQWGKAVGRDIHKMHAFVRFRLVGTDEETGRERFVAWFEPEHRIVRLATPFFRKRFANMEWSILTPDECAHWDGTELCFTPGVERGEAPDEDAHDDLWRTYYRSIFNPARLKVNAMQSEMPKKYWKNLPEARLIAGLISESRHRVQSMLETEELPVKPAPKNAYLESLRKKNEGIDASGRQNRF